MTKYERVKIWREQNPELHKAQRQRYYQKHKNRILETKKDYYRKNRAKVMAYQREYRKAHPEKYDQYRRNQKERKAINE